MRGAVAASCFFIIMMAASAYSEAFQIVEIRCDIEHGGTFDIVASDDTFGSYVDIDGDWSILYKPIKHRLIDGATMSDQNDPLKKYFQHVSIDRTSLDFGITGCPHSTSVADCREIIFNIKINRLSGTMLYSRAALGGEVETTKGNCEIFK